MNFELVMKAAVYAAEAHASHRRKTGDEPYVNHLIRVAESALTAGLSAESIAACFLHDTVEDTSVTEEDLRAAFPSRVVDLVLLLTQNWPDDAPREIKEREKPKYYAKILKDRDAIAIKLLDRADNLNDMARMLPMARRWAEKYLMRSEEEIEPLTKANTNTYALERYEEAVQRLRDALAATPPGPAAPRHGSGHRTGHHGGHHRPSGSCGPR